MSGYHEVDVVLPGLFVVAVREMHGYDGAYAGIGELLVGLLGERRPAGHLAHDLPAAGLLGAHHYRRRGVASRRLPHLRLRVQGVDHVLEPVRALLLHEAGQVVLDHVVRRGVDVEQGDPKKPGGVGPLVVVGAHDPAEDLVPPGSDQPLGDVDRDPDGMEHVGHHVHDLGEPGARDAYGVMGDDGGDRPSLLPEPVGEEDLGGADVYAPHHSVRLDVLRLLGEGGEAGVGVGVPQALHVVDVLPVSGKAVVRLLGAVEDPADLGLRTRVLGHPGLDRHPVGVVDFHVTG